MPSERRSRTTLLLPAPATLHELLLLDAIITELIQLAGGATVSSILPPVFDGWWLDGAGVIVRDANVVLAADVSVPPDDEDLLAYLDALKLRCQREFEQDIVWMTLHSVNRVTTGDFMK